MISYESTSAKLVVGPLRSSKSDFAISNPLNTCEVVCIQVCISTQFANRYSYRSVYYNLQVFTQVCMCIQYSQKCLHRGLYSVSDMRNGRLRSADFGITAHLRQETNIAKLTLEFFKGNNIGKRLVLRSYSRSLSIERPHIYLSFFF